MNILNGIFSSDIESDKAAFKAEKEAMKAEKEAMKAEKEAMKAEKEAMKAEKEAFEATLEAKEAALEAKEAALKQKKQEMSSQFELIKVSLYKQLDDELLFNMIRDSIKKKEEEIKEKNSSIEAFENRIREISYYPIDKIDMFDRQEVDDLNDKKDDLNNDIKACKIVIKYGKELLSSLRDQFKSDKRM